MYETYFRLKNKAQERRYRRCGVFIVNYWTDFTYCSGGSIADYEQVNTGWVSIKHKFSNRI